MQQFTQYHLSNLCGRAGEFVESRPRLVQAIDPMELAIPSHEESLVHSFSAHPVFDYTTAYRRQLYTWISLYVASHLIPRAPFVSPKSPSLLLDTNGLAVHP
jgi:hypothetical protein